MADRNRPHILVSGRARLELYRRPPRRIEGEGHQHPQDRAAHVARLLQEIEAASASIAAGRQVPVTQIEGVTAGAYLVFESFPGIELALESLDPRGSGQHPELVSVQRKSVNGQDVEMAVVRVPDGAFGYFLKRLNKYAETLDRDSPSNQKLVDRIASIGLASLHAIWTDASELFPADDETVWWEIWLRRRDGNELDRLRSYARLSDIQIASKSLVFSDRLVTLALATPRQLSTALDLLDDLAELRKPRAGAELIAESTAVEQAEWVNELQARVVPAPLPCPAVCLVDTGVHQAHPLLSQSLDVRDCQTCDPAWQTSDHAGHGTEMAGVALYGDLGEVLALTGSVELDHGLESVKLLPPLPLENPRPLWGAITATAASLAEIAAPDRPRVFCMPVTAKDEAPPDAHRPQRLGQPTSWSASVDALAAGLGVHVTDGGTVFLDTPGVASQRLFILAAGNVETFQDAYIQRCDLEPIEDPAQSWNALTVGAYTDLTTIDAAELGFDGWTALAERGDLSPYSRTSVSFHRSWPAKPDVVLEGGNVARSPEGRFDSPYSFQRLTTKAPLRDARLLTVIGQTSAATAQAAHLAASIQAEYPSLWPETVRALLVHSAEWTPRMRAEVNAAHLRADRDVLRRRYGMGVPSFARATRSAADALTMIVQDELHPFDEEGRMRDMHVVDLPWPTDILSDLGAAPVRLRVTLSYFVEPNPARRGWARRYGYASHGLRFDLRHPTETTETFRKRINEAARAQDEGRPPQHGSDSQEWCFGPELRTVGSIHTDVWRGRAVDLARRGVIAIFPVAGWWKSKEPERNPGRSARYALVVTIETPGQDVDIWTPVAQQVGIAVEITG
jgi:Subtilase family